MEIVSHPQGTCKILKANKFVTGFFFISFCYKLGNFFFPFSESVSEKAVHSAIFIGKLFLVARLAAERKSFIFHQKEAGTQKNERKKERKNFFFFILLPQRIERMPQLSGAMQ
jgi:hypothetical protein